MQHVMVSDMPDGRFLVRIWPERGTEFVKFVHIKKWLVDNGIHHQSLVVEFLYDKMQGAPIPQRPNWKVEIIRESGVAKIVETFG